MNNGQVPKQVGELRKEAEKKLRSQMDRLNKLSALDVRELVHELGTHQIELEMQNEELRVLLEALEASRSRYANLFDFSPIGYIGLNAAGVINEVNLTGASMLGFDRKALIGKPFAVLIAEREDKAIFYDHCKDVLREQKRMACELELKRKRGENFFARMESIPVRDRDGEPLSLRAALSDISALKAAENEREQLLLDHMDALSKVKTLSGLLPICIHCKKIRDDQGYWNQLEAYISDRSEAEFSHGLCEECAQGLYPVFSKNETGR